MPETSEPTLQPALQRSLFSPTVPKVEQFSRWLRTRESRPEGLGNRSQIMESVRGPENPDLRDVRPLGGGQERGRCRALAGSRALRRALAGSSTWLCL